MGVELNEEQFKKLFWEIYRLESVSVCIRFDKPQAYDNFIRRDEVIRILQKLKKEKV